MEEIDEAIANSEISTASWQTYRNDEYGFEFKYPRGWEVDNRFTTNDAVSFTDPSGVAGSFLVSFGPIMCYPPTEEVNLEEYLRCYGYSSNYQSEEKIINGNHWLRFVSLPRITNTGHGSIRYILVRGRIKYEMVVNWDESPKPVSFIDHIPSTFKFTK